MLKDPSLHAVPEFFQKLFDTAGFPARWHCGDWSEGHGWLHIISDLSVFVAYFAIPISLTYYVRSKKQEIVFPKLYWLFALFILSCGFTHLIEATLFWWPWYRFSGLMKAVTGMVSWVTVIMLIKVMPQAMSLPGAARLNTQLSREIDERKRSESALRESAARLTLAMKHADLGDWSWTAATDECVLSTRASEILGLPASGRPTWSSLRTMIHPADLERILRSKSLDDPESAMDIEFRFKRPSDGREIWAQVRGRLDEGPGNSTRALGIVQDVTARKDFDHERESLLARESSARSEAERANRMKDEFLATLSHELRTPLNAILNWCQLLRYEKGDGAQVETGLNIIERNSRTQVQLIEDLLDMSRIVSGKVRLDVQSVDLATVVRATIETVQPSAADKRIQLSSVLDPMAGPVRGDPARLQQIIWNLLSNALKFTPEGGHVHVAVERMNSQVEISVRDSGIGISPEFLPFVFDRFVQADASSSRRHGGLGLGLSIVKNLTALHGGTVSAESQGSGQGATFRVRLPLPALAQASDPTAVSRIHPSPPADACDVAAPDLSGLRILAVDDDSDALHAVKRLLEGRGASVSAVRTGPEALALLQQEPFHVLLSDIGMPAMDGFELIRLVRLLNGPPGQIPAVALTAFARTEDRQRAMVAGFDNYLSKPVELAELLVVVARLATRVQHTT